MRFLPGRILSQIGEASPGISLPGRLPKLSGGEDVTNGTASYLLPPAPRTSLSTSVSLSVRPKPLELLKIRLQDPFISDNQKILIAIIRELNSL